MSKERYTALELMNMNRADRRRLGKVNSVKIPSVVNMVRKPKTVAKKSKEEIDAINKILDENRNIQK